MPHYEDIPDDRRNDDLLCAQQQVDNLARSAVRTVAAQDLTEVLRQANYLTHMDAAAQLASDGAARYLETKTLASLETAGSSYLTRKTNWHNMLRAWRGVSIPPDLRELPDAPHHL